MDVLPPADRKTKPDSVVVDFSLQGKEFQWLTHACKGTFKWWNTWNVYRTHVFVCTNADTLSYLCPVFYLTIYAGYACDNVDEWPRSYRLSVGRRDDGHWDIERSLGGGQNLVEAFLAVVFIVEIMLQFVVWGLVMFAEFRDFPKQVVEVLKFLFDWSVELISTSIGRLDGIWIS